MALDPSALLRQGVRQLARNDAVRSTLEKAPASRAVVRRFVPGERTEDAVQVAAHLRATGRTATIAHLGGDTPDVAAAQRTRDAHLELLAALGRHDLSQEGRAEVSIGLDSLGRSLPGDGEKVALEHAREICEAAAAVGSTVTLDMEDHTTTDSTLGVLRELRQDFPWVGAVLLASLRRTEQDCRDLAHEGSRVRLCKGSSDEPESVAFQGRHEVDESYVRCMRVLLEGRGYPMFATHDLRIIEIVSALAHRLDRAPDRHEYQMLYGIRSEEQKQIADRGDRMRVYVPIGREWYGYVTNRLAECPATTLSFLRGLASRG